MCRFVTSVCIVENVRLEWENCLKNYINQSCFQQWRRKMTFIKTNPFIFAALLCLCISAQPAQKETDDTQTTPAAGQILSLDDFNTTWFGEHNNLRVLFFSNGRCYSATCQEPENSDLLQDLRKSVVCIKESWEECKEEHGGCPALVKCYFATKICDKAALACIASNSPKEEPWEQITQKSYDVFRQTSRPYAQFLWTGAPLQLFSAVFKEKIDNTIFCMVKNSDVVLIGKKEPVPCCVS